MLVAKLNNLIGQHNLDYSYFVEHVGASKSYWSKFFSNKTSPPSVGKILKLLNQLKTDSYINHHEYMELLRDSIYLKLGVNNLILLQQYEDEIKKLLIEDTNYLAQFYRIYSSNLIAGPSKVAILQALEFLPKEQHEQVLKFIDYALNHNNEDVDVLLRFLNVEQQ